jgi:hypothetical protein
MENMHNINMHKEFSPRRSSSLQLMGQTGSLGDSSEQLQHFAILLFSLLKMKSQTDVFSLHGSTEMDPI